MCLRCNAEGRPNDAPLLYRALRTGASLPRAPAGIISPAEPPAAAAYDSSLAGSGICARSPIRISAIEQFHSARKLASENVASSRGTARPKRDSRSITAACSSAGRSGFTLSQTADSTPPRHSHPACSRRSARRSPAPRDTRSRILAAPRHHEHIGEPIVVGFLADLLVN